MAATSRLAIRRKADYERPCACRSEQGFLFSLRIAGRAGEDFHQAFCAIRVRFQPAVDARGGLTDGCKGPPPAADAFAERSQTVEDDIGEIAVLLEIGAAVVGDRVKPRGVGGRSQIARFRKIGQRRIDDAGSWRVPVGRLLLDQLDDFVAVTGRLGDERERNQT